jgi:hypothetical protein
MLGWAEDGDSDMYTSVWDGSTFPDGSSGPTFASDIFWVVNKSNPLRPEKIMGGLRENGSSDTMYISILDGDTVTWDDQISSTVSTAGTRCFDIAVEYKSGQVLVVANDNSTGLKYWVWDGSSWIVNGSAYPTGLGSGSVNWVRLAASPGSNEIAMVVLKDNAYVYGAIWDGATNSWGDQQTLETSASATTTEAVAVEYINGGTYDGHAMFVWGKSGDDCQFRRWDGSSWQTPSNVGIWTTAAWMTLEPDPNSSKLALCVTSAGVSPSPVNLMVYSGTTNNTERQVHAVFESASGHESDIIITYTDGSYGRYKHYDWNGSSYSMGTVQWFEHSIDLRWLQMARTADGTILVAGKDSDDDLNTWSFDGSTWSHEIELHTAMNSAAKQDFMITPAMLPFFRVSQDHFRWRNDDGGEASGGSISIGTVRSASASGTDTLDITGVEISGDNRYLLVGLCYGPESGQTTTSVVLDPGGADETGLTHLDDATAIIDNDGQCELWGTLAPPTGSNFTVRATLSSAVGSAYDINGGAWPLSGVHQTDTRRTVVTDAATGSPSVTLDSAAGEMVFGTVFMEDATAI